MTSTFDDAEPVAVIGIGCRLPGGANSPAQLWRLLEDGVDAVGPIPDTRWDVDRFYAPAAQRPGRMNAREAGLLEAVDEFDAGFFGISGRVAEQMDPQQRLLLEVCWETMEDAGIPPDSLVGARVGVFVGACSQDYGGLQSAPGEVEGMGAYSATGTFMSILSNRLSYTLDLRGPSMTIDTACSSSLVAVHLATQSVRSGESEVALAGGVNLMLTPQFAIALSQAAMLSPDCRSKAFDATANGYVRGEGAGVVLLKPLSRAQLDGDRIYAVIRGSAVNQDGRTQGITLPNGTAQETNFQTALRNARVPALEVGYIEAHGTGTAVGDPIEASALGRVLAPDGPPQRPTHIGSIKTNIGHLEAGAGIAGLIKAALSVHRRQIAPNLHFHTPNPDIDFDRFGLVVPTEPTPWPEQYPRAIASVNSFGFGGTNANVVLEEPPAPQRNTRTGTRSNTESGTAGDRPVVLPLSARSERALDLIAVEYADLLERKPLDLEQVAANLAVRRNHHQHRLAVVARTREEAAAALRGRADRPVAAGGPGRRSGKVAFLFNGQGPQWYAMGRALLETDSVFRAKVIECDELARRYQDWSILEELTAPDAASSRVNETFCLQPTMFAVQVALAELWRSWGVEPDGVIGHSMGEIAAAHVCGSLDLESALRVICRRSAIQHRADPTGGMLFVALSEEDARELTEQHEQLWVSAVNSPGGSTLSGRRSVLEAVATELSERGVFARLLQVNCACHSPDMEPLREELLAAVEGVQSKPSDIPMYSTVTGARIDGAGLDGDYWWRNFRQPVLFAKAATAALEDGFDTFVELSPHPVLANAMSEAVAAAGADAVVVSSLRRGEDDWATVLGALCALYSAGRDIAWTRRFPDPVPALELPINPWLRESYWNESADSRRYRAGGQRHPMLKRVDAATPTWEMKWDDHRLGWVREHDVLGSTIVPGAAYVEAALAAAHELGEGPVGLRFVEFERACVLPEEELQVGRIEMNPADGTFAVHHRPLRGEGWVRNVRGRFHHLSAHSGPPRGPDVAAIRDRCTRGFGPMDVYGALRRRGYAYGPAFCGISRLHAGDGEALARVQTPRVLRDRTAGFWLHPAVLDACFQVAILQPAATHPDDLLPYAYLPTGIDEIRVYGKLPAAVWCHTRVHKLDASGLLTDVTVFTDDNRVVAEFHGLRGKVVQHATAAAEDEPIEEHFYRLEWRADPQAQQWRAPLPSAWRAGTAEVAAALEPHRRGMADRLDRLSYATDYQADLRRLCAAYVLRCLQHFLPHLGPGDRFGIDDLTDLLPGFRPAVRGYLQFLVEDGFLAPAGAGERTQGLFSWEQHESVDAATLWAEAFNRHPACAWELQLLRRTGTALHEVLTGRRDPVELLFPDGSHAEIEPIYDGSPVARYYNLLVAELVHRVQDMADSRRTLRVLEVGGGTGGLTVNVLPALPADRCEYMFTDISPAFVTAARERFTEYGFLRTTTLDLERGLAEQGIVPGSFDLVLASDVVHATADLQRTLSTLRGALAPGGVLALIEAAPGNRWLDLTFGLTSGWWDFHDAEVRPDGPLLPAPAWIERLGASGFLDAVAITDPDHDGPGSQSLLLAQAPAQEAEAAAPARDVGSWLVLAEQADPLGEEIVRRIGENGERAVLVRRTSAPDVDIDGSTATVVRPGRAEDYDRLLGDTDFAGVLHLVGGCVATGKPDGAGRGGTAVVATGTRACAATVDLVQALHRRSPAHWPRLVTVTRGAHAFRNDRVDLAGALVWGLGTVLGLELPQLQHTMIDLETSTTERDADDVWAELQHGDDEREIAIRGGERFVRRISHLPDSALIRPVPSAQLPAGRGFALTTHHAGSLDAVVYQETELAAPGPGQVEVEVVAAGLNFLDVMTALGQVPPLDSEAGYQFGAEFSGIVARVGEGVTELRPGDAVMGVRAAQGALASHVTVDVATVVRKPAELTFDEAASMPIAYLTAWWALNLLARVVPGERVLIHSATGGTGLAAVRVAQLAGAEVIATAGSPAKRALLRSLGVRHVMDSRSLSFVDEIRMMTDGSGVDVVINSIAGEAMQRSLDCVAPYGRFVELGKRDLLDDRKLGLRPFLHNLSYFGFDLRQMIVDRPWAVRAELGRLVELFRAGALAPLPHRVYHPANVRTALRHLAGARHIGKLVVSMREGDVPVERTTTMSWGGTWLITGGLGGLGLAMAESLADAGVRSLALVGRTGLHDAEARRRVERLHRRGVAVHTAATDVSSRSAVASLLSTIEKELPPLRGVLHCAMVLDDALVTDLDTARLDKAIGPKALAAWNLHELTAHLPLEAFVLFSSATSLVGNIGQANYGAGNAFLDHLAEVRRAQGRPALAVNWGAVADAGFVARNPDVERMVAAAGLRSFPDAQAVHALTRLLLGSHAQVGVLPMDWPRFLVHHWPDGTRPVRYSEIDAADPSRGVGEQIGEGRSLRRRLAELTAEARDALLREHLSGGLAVLLGMPREDLNDEMPLSDYLDSLLTVEISAWLERELEVKVTAMELMRGVSVARLSEQLLSRLESGQAPEAPETRRWVANL